MKTSYPQSNDSKEEVAAESAIARPALSKNESKTAVYAASLFALAKAEGRIDDVGRDLQFVQQTVRDNLNLKGSLSDNELPVERKQAIVSEIFSGKLAPLSLGFVQLLAGTGVIKSIADLISEYRSLVETEERKLIAEVTTAVSLDEKSLGRLASKLSAMTGKDVRIWHEVDESILGGIIVRIEGRLLDGSIRQQLDILKKKMIHRETRGGQRKNAIPTD